MMPAENELPKLFILAGSPYFYGKSIYYMVSGC